MRIHRVYCKSVSGPNTKFALDNIQSHHLIKALRLKEGRVVEVFDGNGSSASCEIVLLNNNKCELERISEVNKDNEPHRTLTNIIPFIKTNNFNYMIQKLSEIGVNKFIIYKPELCDQSIAKKDLEKIIQKSKDIIINVCKQCGNNFLPQIIHTKNLDEAINLIEDDNNKYVFDTDAEKYFSFEELGSTSSVTTITGPESGFSEKELDSIKKNNIEIRYLGENILKAETAPIFVSSIVKNHFGKI